MLAIDATPCVLEKLRRLNGVSRNIESREVTFVKSQDKAEEKSVFRNIPARVAPAMKIGCPIVGPVARFTQPENILEEFSSTTSSPQLVIEINFAASAAPLKRKPMRFPSICV